MSKICNFTKMASSKQNITTALKSVICNIETAVSKRPETLPSVKPRLVAVTKTKPAESVVTAYEYGQRYFGENYVNEMAEKVQNPEIVKLSEIKWHFIGHLQRNKVKKLLTVPNLYMVETVDSIKLAESLDNGWEKLDKPDPLKIMIQVNTSKEDNKAGCNPDQVVEIYKFIRETCLHLEVTGLMTIGSFDHDLSKGPNPDFQTLIQCREALCKEIGLNVDQIELSMGMSADYEHAIELGSTNVRVGSTIFGSREVKKKVNEPTKTETNTESSDSGPVANMSSNECEEHGPVASISGNECEEPVANMSNDMAGLALGQS